MVTVVSKKSGEASVAQGIVAIEGNSGINELGETLSWWVP